MLYRVDITLASRRSYEAINYFFDSVDTKIPDMFFKNINASIDPETIEEYNKFVKTLMNKTSFDTETINTHLSGRLEDAANSQNNNGNHTLEYLGIAKCLNVPVVSIKLAGKLDTRSDSF